MKVLPGTNLAIQLVCLLFTHHINLGPTRRPRPGPAALAASSESLEVICASFSEQANRPRWLD